MAQQLTHFYDPDEAAFDLIAPLVERGTTYTKEDVSQHAWAELLRCYFPKRFATIPPGQPAPPVRTKYSVLVQPYRGLPLAANHTQKPDVVVLQMINTNQAGGTQKTKRDALWVECKAPSKDQPYQWNNVLDEAVTRLHVAHSTRNIFLILNVGLEWIMLYWDPQNPAPAGQNLRLVDAQGRPRWDVDRRVRPIQAAGLQYTFGGDPITNGVIYPDRAKTIDCITTAVANGQMVLAYQNDLVFLEQCLVQIAGANFQGNNDPTFV